MRSSEGGVGVAIVGDGGFALHVHGFDMSCIVFGLCIVHYMCGIRQGEILDWGLPGAMRGLSRC